MNVIRKASLTPIPWKNGGGVTREVIRSPKAPDPFRWRLSVAQIDAPGPFSNFGGYRRTMVLLLGAGVRLTFADGRRAELRGMGSMVEFDGEPAPYCELTDGACVDLNLMVATSRTAVRAWVEPLRKPRRLQSAAHTTTLAYAIDGPVSVALDSGEATRLDAWDLAVVGATEGGTVGPAMVPTEGGGIGPAAIEESAAPLVFFATLEDNPL